MTAPYEVFYNIFIGKSSAVKVIATCKARVKGNLAKLLKYTGAINRFVEVCRICPTSSKETSLQAETVIRFKNQVRGIRGINTPNS